MVVFCDLMCCFVVVVVFGTFPLQQLFTLDNSSLYKCMQFLRCVVGVMDVSRLPRLSTHRVSRWVTGPDNATSRRT